MIYAREGEDLKRHTGLALGVFEKIKDRFIRRLARLAKVDEKTAEEALRRAIILHDIGKASRSFQDYLKRLEELREKYDDVKLKAPIRHELLSAYIAYVAFLGDLPNNLRKAVARAIALHHQRRLLGKLKGDKYYRLTKKLFKTMARIGDEVLDPGFVEDRPKALELIESRDPDEVLDDLRNFGRNPYEKALVGVILDAIIESDRVATAFSSGNLEPKDRMPAYLEKIIEEGIEPVEFSIGIHPLELEKPKEDYVEIETPGYSPIRDSLFVFGLVSMIDKGEVLSDGHKLLIRIPKEELQKISEERIVSLYYAALTNLTELPGKLTGDFPIIGKGKGVLIYQTVAPDVGGTYQRLLYTRTGKGPDLRKYLESALSDAAKKLGVSEEILSRLTLIGLAFYGSAYSRGKEVTIFYPLIRPGRYSVAELKYSIQASLAKYSTRAKNYLTYTAIRDFVFSIAAGLDLDELDFFIATFDTTPNKPAIRHSFTLSSLRLRDFVVDLIGNMQKMRYIRYLSDVVNVSKRFIEIDPIATAEIAQGINELDLGALYRGAREILSEIARKKDTYMAYHIGELLEFAATRVGERILEESGAKRI